MQHSYTAELDITVRRSRRSTTLGAVDGSRYGGSTYAGIFMNASFDFFAVRGGNFSSSIHEHDLKRCTR